MWTNSQWAFYVDTDLGWLVTKLVSSSYWNNDHNKFISNFVNSISFLSSLKEIVKNGFTWVKEAGAGGDEELRVVDVLENFRRDDGVETTFRFVVGQLLDRCIPENQNFDWIATFWIALDIQMLV